MLKDLTLSYKKMTRDPKQFREGLCPKKKSVKKESSVALRLNLSRLDWYPSGLDWYSGHGAGVDQSVWYIRK